MSAGGFNLPGIGNPYSSNPQNAGYPPQNFSPYNINSMPQQSHQPGYYPPPQGAACPNPHEGYTPQQMPFAPGYGSPYSNVPYPPGPGANYGVGSGLVAAGQMSMYPINQPQIQTQHPYNHVSSGYSYPGQSYAANGTNVELTVFCTNLKDKDVFSKSDPVCLLFEKYQERWIEIGRTEMILNDLNPRWTKKFNINSNPQTSKQLKFEVYDWDNQSQKTNRQDFLGRAEINLATILTSPGKQISSSLKNGGGGKITILAEEMNSNSQEKIRLQLEAHKLDRMDFLGKSDPYYTLSKKMENGQWALVHKSEVIYNNCNPRWPIMDKSANEICNGDYQRELKIEIFDYDSTSKDDVIGEFVTNLHSLKNGFHSQTRYEVINQQKLRSKRGYRNSGTLSVKQFIIC